jgi:hypothetical protein
MAASAPHLYATDQAATAAQQNTHPQGILAIAEITTTVAYTPTGEVTIITAPAVTFLAANRRIRIRFHCRGISTVSSGGLYAVRIKEGSTILNDSHFYAANTAIMATGGCDFEAIVSNPTAASHTYYVTCQQAVGSSNATFGGYANGPITLVVEDVGTAS